MKLSSLSPRNLYASLRLLMVRPYARLLRKRSRDIWLIAERPDQARDNGYCFFKYLREQHPELEAYYVIRRDAPDRAKLEPYGNIIDYNSWKHFLYFCASRVHISAHDNMCAPDHLPILRFLSREKLGYKNVFLPHGVSYGVSEFCLAKYNKFDLFVCSGQLEYENMLANYGYRPEQLAYTGFPRLDAWHHITVDRKQLLLMPTWRAYLAQNPDTLFEETAYYKAFQSLLNHSALSALLESSGCRLVFYLHNDMRKYEKYFQTPCKNIIIVRDDTEYDIQELLKSSALLITDYSSVHFDFSYMDKPVIYYQFDREDFFAKQYQQGMFDPARDGFGPVVLSEETLISEIKKAIDSGFTVEEQYHQRMRNFYRLYDEKNCERVYETIREKEANQWRK